MDPEQQTSAPQKSETEEPGKPGAASARSVEAPARVFIVSARLWAYGGQQRKLRDFAWLPEGPVAATVEALARENSGKVVDAGKNLLTLSFGDPLHSVAAARALQQRLLAGSQGAEDEHITAAVAVYAQTPVKAQRRRGLSADDEELRRPLKDSDLPQIMVSEEIYKQVKDAPGFQFSDRPSRAAGGSKPTEMMYGLQWADGLAYSEVRQAIHEAGMPRFSRYAIHSELGRGTMGVVYKAHDQSIDRTVALKTISLSSNAADLDESVERLRQEAKAAGNLDHPNIITIYDVGQEDGFFFLSMQFVEGANFSDLLANGRLQPLSTVLSYIDQICAAVGFAHQRGVVHRDLKPSNIMLTGQGTIKVLDFGIAKLGNAGLTQAGMVVGTPSYMAPEQAMGRKVDQRSDIFALGAVFYEFFTGKRPFVAQDVTAVLYKVVHEEPQPPAAVEPLLPIGIDAIVRRALAKSPQDRYQSCEEMREAFRAQAILLAPNPGLKPPAPRPAPAVRPTPANSSTTTRSRVVPQPKRRSAWPAVVTWLAVFAMAAGFWAGRSRWKDRIGGIFAQHAKAPEKTEAVKSDNAGAGAVVPDTKAAADDGKAQPTGVTVPANDAAAPATPQPPSSTGASSDRDSKPPAPSAADAQAHPADKNQPAPNGTAGNANQPSVDSSKSNPDTTGDDANPPAASKPKAARPTSIDGFSRSDIPALLRKADAAAGRGEYSVARYEYTVILRLEPRNAGALAGLRHVNGAEKGKSK